MHDVRPRSGDGVEGERVLRPAVLLGDREQQEGKLLDELDVDCAVGPLLHARQERARGWQPVALKECDQVMEHLPDADAVIGENVVVLRQLRQATAA